MLRLALALVRPDNSAYINALIAKDIPEPLHKLQIKLMNANPLVIIVRRLLSVLITNTFQLLTLPPNTLLTS